MNCNIHINPNFIPKPQAQIHFNPSFVNKLKQKFDSSHSGCSDFPKQNFVHSDLIRESKKDLYSCGERVTGYDSSGFTSNSLSTPSNDFISNGYSLTTTGTGTHALPNTLTHNFEGHAIKSTDTCIQPVKRFSSRTKCNSSAMTHSNKFYSSEYLSKTQNLTQLPSAKFEKANISVRPNTHSLNVYKKQNMKCDSKISGEYKSRYSLDKRPVKLLGQPIKFNSANNLLSRKTDRKKSSPFPLDAKDEVPVRKIVQTNSSYGTKDQSLITQKIETCPSLVKSTIHNNSNDLTSKTSVLISKSDYKLITVSCTNQMKKQTLSSKISHLYPESPMKIPGPKQFPNTHLEKYGRRKSSFAIKTRTKLIRRNSLIHRFKKNNLNPNTLKPKKASPYRKGFLIKSKENRLRRSCFHLRRVSLSEDFRIKSKYKLINKPKRANEPISKYPIQRSFNSRREMQLSLSQGHTKKQRSSLLKSDKFINIEGNLYKSTRTSLKKQDLTAKTYKGKDVLESKVKFKRSPQNSKFVYRRQSSTELQSGTLIEIVRRKKLAHFKRINDHCFFYTKYGRCKKEKKGCPFIHDPSRVPVCTRFLQGSCSVKGCSFLHTLDKSKMPVCSHFVDGAGCHREKCPYRHVRVNPKAPFCRNFLKGHCPIGEECKKKHILICEDFKAKGACPRGKKCPLSHPRRRRETSTKRGKRRSSYSTKKRAVSKHPPPRKRQKIGVLGLGLESGNNVETVPSKLGGKRGNVSLGRYFDCSQKEASTNNRDSPLAAPVAKGTVATETARPEVVSSSMAEGFGPSTVENTAFESKRQRLLDKIEKVKKNYYIQDSSDCPFERRSEPPKRGDGVTNTSAPMAQHRAKPVVNSVLRFRPLPDVLPSFIPLTLPETSPEKGNPRTDFGG